MRRIPSGLLPLASAVVLAACGQAAQQADNGPVGAETALHVRNNNLFDVTVYLLDGGTRVRLGSVTGLSSQTLMMASHLVRGPRELRFLIDPIGGGRSWTSEPILVTPGDIIQLTIPAI
jgi:hypothetical protein